MFDGAITTVEPYFVGLHDVERWLPRVRPHLQKMAEGSGDRYLTEDIEACVREGKILLWLMLRGPELMCVIATEIKEYPRLRAMRFIGLVGHQPRAWRRMLVELERAARDGFGCQKMEAVHLPKFSNLLPGYAMTHLLSERNL